MLILKKENDFMNVSEASSNFRTLKKYVNVTLNLFGFLYNIIRLKGRTNILHILNYYNENWYVTFVYILFFQNPLVVGFRWTDNNWCYFQKNILIILFFKGRKVCRFASQLFIHYCKIWESCLLLFWVFTCKNCKMQANVNHGVKNLILIIV